MFYAEMCYLSQATTSYSRSPRDALIYYFNYSSNYFRLKQP